MTSFAQWQANRRNAGKSTGPITPEGKEHSRRNAVRHGLTAETVIGALEDAEDYKAFEAAIIADYDAQSAIERELVLRLASLLWRLRRATTIETGLFDIQASHFPDFRQAAPIDPTSRAIVYEMFGNAERTGQAEAKLLPGSEPTSPANATNLGIELAHCFLRLADLPNYALDRLNRYEVMLWRQAEQNPPLAGRFRAAQAAGEKTPRSCWS